MATKWIMTRLRESTRKRLTGVLERLQRAADRGAFDVPVNHYDHTSVDALVNVLLDREERHQDRKKG